MISPGAPSFAGAFVSRGQNGVRPSQVHGPCCW